jgi:hypothetical protein
VTPVLSEEQQTKLRQQVRLLVLLDAVRAAGLSPIAVGRLHVVAYLSDVLSPVWNLVPFDGEVYKRQQGPFYPELQRDLDHLVGLGMVRVERVRHIPAGKDRARIAGEYSINRELAGPVLDLLPLLPGEEEPTIFLRELAFALSSLSDEDIDRAFEQDATYSNRKIGNRNVIEFHEWANLNYSANAAAAIGSLVPTEAVVGSGEKIHLYMRHLKSRLHGGR